MRILFRCDGGRRPETGTGHVVRSLLLAERLSAVAHVAFALRDFGGQASAIERAGHTVFTIAPDVPEPEATLKVMAAFCPDVLVVDRLGNRPEHVRAFKGEATVVAVLDDPEGGDEADLAINAILGAGRSPYEGADYLVLPNPGTWTPARSATPDMLVLSFGGFDPADLISKAVRAASAVRGPISLRVAVGDGDPRRSALEQRLREQPHPWELLVGLSPADFSARLRESTIAVVAGGLTMYDAVRHGVPAIVLSQYGHQAANADELASAGAVVHLGLGAAVSEETVRSSVESLLGDAARRAALGRRGSALVDGAGTERVARLLQIVERLPWDSEFFGFCVARLWPKRLTPALADLADRRCAALGVRCLYFLGDAADVASAALATARGFVHVDTRVTLRRRTGPSATSRGRGVAIRPVRPADVPTLVGMAAFTDSRFYVDPHFSRRAAKELYRIWVEKSCAGSAEMALVADAAGAPVGFITCECPRPGHGVIGLVAVDGGHAGRGIGSTLVEHAVDWFAGRGVDEVEVATQDRNTAALRLYEHCGFERARAEPWFHRWFDAAEVA